MLVMTLSGLILLQFVSFLTIMHYLLRKVRQTCQSKVHLQKNWLLSCEKLKIKEKKTTML